MILLRGKNGQNRNKTEEGVVSALNADFGDVADMVAKSYRWQWTAALQLESALTNGRTMSDVAHHIQCENLLSRICDC